MKDQIKSRIDWSTAALFTSILGLFATIGILAFQTKTADAAGHIGPANVVTELRTQTANYPLQITNDSVATDAGSVTQGKEGVIAVTTVNDVGTRTFSQDAGTISPPPYPCKLSIVLLDDGTGQTIECAMDGGTSGVDGGPAVDITGWNQFGESVSESIQNVTETAGTSARVYENVNSITVRRCNGAGQANDVVRVSCSTQVGLPWKAVSQNALERLSLTNVTVYDQSVTNTAYTYRPDDVVAEGTASAYDVDDNSVNCVTFTDAGVPALTAAMGDICQIRQRYPNKGYR